MWQGGSRFGGEPPRVASQGKSRAGPAMLARWMDHVRAGSCLFSAIDAKGGQENGTHRHFHFCRRLLQILVPVAHILKLANNSPSCIIQALFKLLPLCWVSGWAIKPAGSLRVGTRFPIALCVPRVKPYYWFSQPDVTGTHLPSTGPQGWSAQCGAWSPPSSTPVISFPLAGGRAGYLVPNHSSFSPTLSDVAFSLWVHLWKMGSSGLQVVFRVSCNS